MIMSDWRFDKAPLVIAEVGVNHNGDTNQALQLIDVAVASGADIVKFQTFTAKKLATESAPQARYQTDNIGKAQTQLALLKSLELTHEMHLALIKHCKTVGIEFLSTAFDIAGLHYLLDLGVRRIKIPSGDLTNLPYLEVVGSCGLPVILSTGMATMPEIKASCEVLYQSGLSADKLTILHCTTNYPAMMTELNMAAMNTIRTQTGVAIGYSDHSQGIEAAIIAVTLGASVIEKHITLDKSLPGPDHLASMEPDEFKRYVSAIHNSYSALGDGVKQPSPSEVSNASIVRKSIVASKYIFAGDFFSVENITTKRPATGLSAMRWREVLGARAKRDFEPDEMIEI